MAERFVRGLATGRNCPIGRGFGKILLGFREFKAHNDLRVIYLQKWIVLTKEENNCIYKDSSYIRSFKPTIKIYLIKITVSGSMSF